MKSLQGKPLSEHQKLIIRANAERERRRRLGANYNLSFDEWLQHVTPKYNWTWPHLTLIQEELQALYNGDTKRLMLFLPPRHGKTELVTIRYPAWYLERHPDRQIIVGCYNQMLANRFSRKTRAILRERIPLNEERTAVEDWQTKVGGGYRAVGVGAGITGQGGDLIIIDDPVKSREEANSTVYRERTYNWFTDDLFSRLEPDAKIILIMTRWHQDDLAGRILASSDADNWEVVSLPALAESNDILGRAEGDALCVERYNREALLQIKEVQRTSFESLYQQRPSAIEGSILKREYWQYYEKCPPFKFRIQSWDTAYKTDEGNDYSVCLTFGVTDNSYYILDCFKSKLEFPQLRREVIRLAGHYQPNEILIEDRASGQSLIQVLRQSTNFPIIAVQVDRDKETRAHAAAGILEAGRLFVPRSAPWVNDFLNNCAIFPNGTHDDEVDAFTQFLTRYAYRRPREFAVL